MEEILASIRRIIEDGNPPEADGPKPAAAGEVKEFAREFGQDAIAESLQHAGAMTPFGVENDETAGSPAIEAALHREAAAPADFEIPSVNQEIRQIGDDDMAALERVELHKDDADILTPAYDQIESPQPEEKRFAETPFERQLRPILSDMAGRQVTAAFSDLTMAIEKERQQSLAEIAEDMIRPMLQEWLDNNLPTMVERLVREEIERVSQSGRR